MKMIPISLRACLPLALVVSLLAGCSSKPVAAVTVTTTQTTVSTQTTAKTIEKTTELTTTVTKTETAPAITTGQAGLVKVSRTVACEMMVSSVDGTPGPVTRLSDFVAAINLEPTATESQKLALETAEIASAISDLASHAPSDMATHFSRLADFAQLLSSIYAGSSSESSFNTSDIKEPALALVEMCLG